MASRKTEREAKRLLLTMSPVCARGRILQVAFHPCIVKVVPERFFRMASTAATSSSACSVVRLSLARGCCGCCSSVFVAANGRSCSISSSSSLTASEACVSSNDSAGSFSGSSAIETSESAAVTTRAAISLHTTTALALRPSAPTGRSGSSLWLRLIHVATSIGCSSIAPTAAAVRAPDRGSARRERDGRRAGGLWGKRPPSPSYLSLPESCGGAFMAAGSRKPPPEPPKTGWAFYSSISPRGRILLGLLGMTFSSIGIWATNNHERAVRANDAMNGTKRI